MSKCFKVRLSEGGSMFLPRKVLEKKLTEILAEDIGQGDITTALIAPAGVEAEAVVIAREQGIIAGVEETKILWESMGLRVESSVDDGECVQEKQVLMRVSGDVRTILSTERTALNILTRMSGIATVTRRLVEKLRKAELETRIACTRKVAPGLLYFDKKAVSIGGGDVHRLHLDDLILIKDNHVVVAGGVERAVKVAKEKSSFTKKIEVEVTRADDALVAAKAGADIIMFDNFSPKQVERACVLLKKARLRGRVLTEASGGISEENFMDFASAGVDVVSLGAITSSARTLNISLEVSRVAKKAQSRLEKERRSSKPR